MVISYKHFLRQTFPINSTPLTKHLLYGRKSTLIKTGNQISDHHKSYLKKMKLSQSTEHHQPNIFYMEQNQFRPKLEIRYSSTRNKKVPKAVYHFRLRPRRSSAARFRNRTAYSLRNKSRLSDELEEKFQNLHQISRYSKT
jgi:hypothetical protein